MKKFVKNLSFGVDIELYKVTSHNISEVRNQAVILTEGQLCVYIVFLVSHKKHGGTPSVWFGVLQYISFYSSLSSTQKVYDFCVEFKFHFSVIQCFLLLKCALQHSCNSLMQKCHGFRLGSSISGMKTRLSMFLDTILYMSDGTYSFKVDSN